MPAPVKKDSLSSSDGISPQARAEVRRRFNIIAALLVAIIVYYLYRYGLSFGLSDGVQAVLLSFIIGLGAAVLYSFVRWR